jgi:hypothetical protein
MAGIPAGVGPVSDGVQAIAGVAAPMLPGTDHRSPAPRRAVNDPAHGAKVLPT